MAKRSGVYSPDDGVKASNQAAAPVIAVPPKPRAQVRLTDSVNVSPTVTLDGDGAGLADDIARIAKMRRRPMGALRQKLALEPISGYFIHWFNDTAGRIDEALAAGWAHIKDQDGKPKSLVVGVGRDGKPMLAFAMKIPEVFHQEDMDARHADAQAKVDAIKENPFRARAGEAKSSDRGKFYSPESADTPLEVNKG